MKKIKWKVLIILSVIVLLTGCSSQNMDLANTSWKVEFVADQKGRMLISSDESDTLLCVADKDNNITISYYGVQERSWIGKFEEQKRADSTKEYKITFTDGSVVTAILGKKIEYNGTATWSLVFYSEDKIASFVPR